MAAVFASDGSGGVQELNDASIDSAMTRVPLTISAWVYLPASGSGGWGNEVAVIASAGKSSASNHHTTLYLFRAQLRAVSRAGSGAAQSAFIHGVTAAGWHHVGGVWASTTSRVAYFDGVAATADTNDREPADLDKVTIGNWAGTNSDAEMDGNIAEVAFWSTALSTDDFLALADGYAAPTVKPESLISYMPMVSDYVDHWGRHAWVTTDSPVYAAHPPIKECHPVVCRGVNFSRLSGV